MISELVDQILADFRPILIARLRDELESRVQKELAGILSMEPGQVSFPGQNAPLRPLSMNKEGQMNSERVSPAANSTSLLPKEEEKSSESLCKEDKSAYPSVPKRLHPCPLGVNMQGSKDIINRAPISYNSIKEESTGDDDSICKISQDTILEGSLGTDADSQLTQLPADEDHHHILENWDSKNLPHEKFNHISGDLIKVSLQPNEAIHKSHHDTDHKAGLQRQKRVNEVETIGPGICTKSTNQKPGFRVGEVPLLNSQKRRVAESVCADIKNESTIPNIKGDFSSLSAHFVDDRKVPVEKRLSSMDEMRERIQSRVSAKENTRPISTRDTKSSHSNRRTEQYTPSTFWDVDYCG
jgi:hypothetical protein